MRALSNRTLFVIVFLLVLGFINVTSVVAQASVVHAVLFFSPTCSHCHYVMDEVLPPLVERFPNQIDIVGIDVSQNLGQALYQSTVIQFSISDDRIGVPTLVIKDIVLVGATEIENQLPTLIEQSIAEGGSEWPYIPGLQQVLDAQPKNNNQETQTSLSNTDQPGGMPNQTLFVTKFQQDPVANSIAVIVLVLMVISLLWVSYHFIRGELAAFLKWPHYLTPIFAGLGLLVAAYLSYVEVSSTEAICGPIGNCNSVQQSPYAYLFGVIPIGVLGLIGYSAIIVFWLLQHFGPKSFANFSAFTIWGMAWFGVLFSIYLTFLEPFVIGATCAWCVASAILMTLVSLSSTHPAIQATRITNIDYEGKEEDQNDEWKMISDESAHQSD